MIKTEKKERPVYNSRVEEVICSTARDEDGTLKHYYFTLDGKYIGEKVTFDVKDIND